MKTQEKLNMTMLCDFYELTMGNGYFEAGCKDRITYFDVFFRKVPDGWRLRHCSWTGAADRLHREPAFHSGGHRLSPQPEPVLRGVSVLSPRISALPGDIYAIPEGTPVFPRSRWWWCVPRPSRPS